MGWLHLLGKMVILCFCYHQLKTTLNITLNCGLGVYKEQCTVTIDNSSLYQCSALHFKTLSSFENISSSALLDDTQTTHRYQPSHYDVHVLIFKMVEWEKCNAIHIYTEQIDRHTLQKPRIRSNFKIYSPNVTMTFLISKGF